MSQNLFALNWTSSINNQCIPEDYENPNYEHLFTFHMKNLVDNLVKSASWDVVSCSYWNTASNAYETIGNSNKWETIENIKFPERMVTGSYLDEDGNIKYELITANNGLYTPTEHPWILLKHTRSMDYYGQSNNYMVIDCRYPLPPHKTNVGIVYDTNGEELNEAQIGASNKRIVLGTSAVKRQKFITQNTISKRAGRKTVNQTVSQEVQAHSLDTNFNYFNGIAERDNLNYTFKTPLADEIQDYNSRAVAFVDILYSSRLPYSGSTTCRPITNN
jgi:hypothetical protein